MGRATCVACAILALSCGARSGLYIPEFDAGPDAGRDGGFVCATHVTLEPARAEVVLVLDRSGSMTGLLGDTGITRDDALRAALDAALPGIDDEMAVGALLFPIMNATLPDGTACEIPRDLDVAVDVGTSDRVRAAMSAHGPSGGTPTADALSRAYEALSGRIGAFVPAVVLATDGGPNCDPRDRDEPWYGLSPESCLEAGYPIERCLDEERTLAAISDARRDGIPTYVIGMDVTLPILVDVLDRMAIEGGRPRDGARRYYDAADPRAISDALEEIAAEVSACTFVPTAPIDDGTVHVDGDPSDAWESGPAGTIELEGDLCARANRPGAMVTFGPRCER